MSKILAYIESRDNRIKNSGFEAASAAKKYSAELNCQVEALLVGSGVSALAQELGKYGIKKVLVADDSRLEKYSTTAYAGVIAAVCAQAGADISFLSATSLGRDVGPRTAAKLEAGLAVDCTSLRVEK